MATMVEGLARFVHRTRLADMSEAAVMQLKIRVLDAVGCALGALGGEPVQKLRSYVDRMDGAPLCTLIGGGRTSPDRAAFLNGALVRYLDFNDSFLAKGETCHPSDNVGAVLAAAEYADRSGADFLAALAAAYQVQCRLSEAAPVRHKGFDHTTQGAFAAAAGAARALGLDEVRTAHAVAISGTALPALRVTRTGALSHWKGLAYPHTGSGALQAALLAAEGITGPLEVFEGNKGFMDAIAGRFELDWEQEDLEAVTRTIVKKYNAEIHSQSVLEGLLELRALYRFRAEDVEAVEVDVFDVAYHIIGGGEEGDKTEIRTKEEADHSLPYLAAVALLDGQVMPAQYHPERILGEDVQGLLGRIRVCPSPEFSARFPAEMPCRLTVRLKDGRRLEAEKRDYEGFFTRPVTWEGIQGKFLRLTPEAASAELSQAIVAAVERLEQIPVRNLTALLGKAGQQ
jgi:2-methylcitrate dehydratase